MPLVPDQNRKSAAKLGTEFKAFIPQIKNLNASTSQNTLQKFQDTFLSLKVRANAVLGTISQELNASLETQVEDYYYREFLTQVSRYNQYFNEIIHVTDIRDDGVANQQATLDSFPGKQILSAAAITPIKHSLLEQSSPTTMKVTITTDENIFRKHLEYTEDGAVRHYYNPKDTTLDEKATHQDRTHYLEANVRIGAATQVSNGRGIFKFAYGQGTDEYFKTADRANHAREKKCFEEAMLHIQNGETLSDEHLAVLQHGKFYRYPKVIKFQNTPPEEKQHPDVPNHHLTHVGHAAEAMAINGAVPLTLVIDPVHKQSGTDGLITVPAKLFYDRQTAPGVATDAYPKINVVIISHNHHDHMCPSSLQEGFAPANTLFIVPKGDAAHMHRFGLSNVIEFNSWNDSAIIELTNKGKTSLYEIRSFPAKHASNRGPRDLYESLYMGYMIRDLTKDHVIIFTGDTGVLDEEHFNQLEAYLIKNKLTIHTACIAHGPDRPRKWMECTHQSTADAIVMHARFNMINAAVNASKSNGELNDLNYRDIDRSACHAIGYHQGCFRLGLLLECY
jgi:L-ascorbate metabolism protein UlaG (beta-lactamase superfamily)